MSAYVIMFLSAIGSLAFALCFAPLLLRLLRREHAGQNILGYVTQHEVKSGTPTMGGWIFVLPICIGGLAAFQSVSLVASAGTFAFAVLGFLDDFIKVKFNRNLGLKPYQKIIGQTAAAFLLGWFVYKSSYVGTAVNFPFLPYTLDLSWGIIPFVMLIFVATTNAVNLTDGLDGLAGFCSLAYFLAFSLVLALTYSRAIDAGEAGYAQEIFALAVFSFCAVGAVGGYLFFNAYPAKIFMGDTGSLALGAAAASVAVFSKNPFLIPVAGIMFVLSCISVIVQVLAFKATKKRVFLMTPLHHHFEMKGVHESKITASYFLVSLFAGAVAVIASGVI